MISPALFPEPLPVIEIVTETRMSPPEGMVYSTSPISAQSDDGVDYVVKGFGDIKIVCAEAVAYLLANELGLPVPGFSLARRPNSDEFLFASEKVVTAFRNAAPYLRSASRIRNYALLANLVVFDIWIANLDRNLGNILIQPLRKQPVHTVEFISIDFEKAEAIRGPYPVMLSAQVPPKKLWPTGELGRLIGGIKIPIDFVTRIYNFQRQDLEYFIESVRITVEPQFEWHQGVIDALDFRRKKINTLVEEAWQ